MVIIFFSYYLGTATENALPLDYNLEQEIVTLGFRFILPIPTEIQYDQNR